jgi:hypothetical protein
MKTNQLPRMYQNLNLDTLIHFSSKNYFQKIHPPLTMLKISFAAFFISISTLCISQNNLKTESVSIFKDGNSFYTKLGVVKATKGTYKIKEIPEARFGSFWIDSPNQSIGSIISHFDTVKIEGINMTQEKISKVIDINFLNNNTEQPLQLMYLQRGLSWKPFYRFEIINDKRAKITLRSEVTNDAENLENTTVNFVVGIPNFRFSNKMTSLIDLTNRTKQDEDEYNQTYRNGNGGSLDEVVVVRGNFNNQITGENVEDSYFYPIKNFTLMKGSRGHFQLFLEEVDYEHIYECDITSQQNSRTPNKVFHGMKIYNNSKNPFVSAPALILENKNNKIAPLAQDLINYTPIKSSSIIRVAETPEIEVKNEEIVKKREQEREEFGNRSYYKSTIEATIIIKNSKNKDVKFELKQTLNGILDKSIQNLKILSQKTQFMNPNLTNQIQWEFNLKANEEKTISYEFQVYNQ